MAAACFLAIAPRERVSFAVLFLTLLFFFGFQQLRGGFRCFRDRHKDPATWSRVGAMIFWMLIPFLCAAAALGFIWLAMNWVQLPPRSDSQSAERWSFLPISIGPALMILSGIAGMWLEIGLMGLDFQDGAREWLAQFGSRLWIVTMLWTAVFAISIYGALWVARLTLWKLPALGAAVTWAGPVGLPGGAVKQTERRHPGRVALRLRSRRSRALRPRFSWHLRFC